MVTGVVPHVGGPILPPGNPTVMIGYAPAAGVGDMCTCVGPPDVIAMGSPTVLINYKMAARLGDPTAHGGSIVMGFPTVQIGVSGAGSVSQTAAAMGAPTTQAPAEPQAPPSSQNSGGSSDANANANPNQS
jgi:uncharacterized Zn-binding protein involved in type VI secretion